VVLRVADHYTTLGVAREASADEIKRAYRKLARELHPDVNPDATTHDKFKEVTEAYETLSDPQKRQHYDMGGGSSFGGAGFGFGDVMDAFFGGSGSRGPKPRVRRGQDALIRVEIDLHDAVFGVDHELHVDTAVGCEKCDATGRKPGTSTKTCDICRGRGEVQQVAKSFLGQVMTSRPCNSCQGYGSTIISPCVECAGDGRVRSRRTIDIHIPAGVETGSRLRLDGRGEVGPGGGPAGDLYVEMVVIPHPSIVREGDNLHLPFSIPMTAAALGATVEVETLDGVEEVDIKPGIQSGEQIILRGLGVGRLRQNGRGDFVVHVEVLTPSKLDAEQVELLQALAQKREEVMPAGEHGPLETGFMSKIKDAFTR